MKESGRTRVVVLDHVARLSGAEIALLRLAPVLLEQVDLHVLLGEDGPLVERLTAVGVPVEVLPLAPRVRDLRRENVRATALDARALLPLPAYLARLTRRLRALRPDVVHTNSLKAALYGGVAGRLAGVPVLWHVRDRISEDYLPPGAVRLVRGLARILPSAVVANSAATLATLPPLPRSRVLYNPIIPDAVAFEHAGGDRTETELTVGILGRLAPWKGQSVFLDAFASAFPAGDTRARVIGSALFGEDDYAEGLRRRADELGIAGRVEFRGFRENVWVELAALDVLVHCSVTPEPFGQVVLEGMAAGLPVVATDGGGPAELITDGVDGLLVPPGDPVALAATLRRLAGDAGLRTRLSEAARVRSAAFTPERAAQQLAEVYATILRARRPTR